MGRADQQLSVWIGVAVAAGMLLVQAGVVTVSDGATMLAVTQSIVHHGTLAVPTVAGTLGQGGHAFAKYGLGLSVAALPFVVVADMVSLAVGHQTQLESFAASSLMPVVMGLLAFTLRRTSSRLGAAPAWASVIAVGAVLGTYALPYGKEFLSEPLTTLAIAIAFDEILSERYLTAGLGIAAATFTRPEAGLLVLLVPLVILVMKRDLRASVVCGAAASIGAVADALYDYYRFGNLLKSGYGSESFTTPFLHGAGGLLFTANKSVFIFAPIVILLVPAGVRLWRGNPAYVMLVTVNFAVFFVLTSLWHSWQGGWSWGPRLILPGVITAMPLLAPASAVMKRVGVCLFVIGFAVSASTVIVLTRAQQLDQPLPRWGPAVLRQYALIPRVVTYSVQHAHAPHQPGASRRYLALWQFNLDRQLGAGGLLIGLTGSVLLLVAIGYAVGRARLTAMMRTSTP